MEDFFVNSINFARSGSSAMTAIMAEVSTAIFMIELDYSMAIINATTTPNAPQEKLTQSLSSHVQPRM